MNSVNKPISAAKNEATTQAAQMFNSKFIAYEGTGKSPETVKQLLNLVATTRSKDSNHEIIIRWNTGTTWDTGWKTAGEAMSLLKDEKTYSIAFRYAEYQYDIDNKLRVRWGNALQGAAVNDQWKTEAGYITGLEIEEE